MKKILIESLNFFYELKENSFVYVPADAFCFDKEGTLYLEKDTYFYQNYKSMHEIFWFLERNSSFCSC